MAAGDIYTIAGSAKGPGTAATAARPGWPARVVIGTVSVDRAGNLVFADTGDNAVRVVATKTGTYYGQAMTVRGHLHRGRRRHGRVRR